MLEVQYDYGMNSETKVTSHELRVAKYSRRSKPALQIRRVGEGEGAWKHLAWYGSHDWWLYRTLVQQGEWTLAEPSSLITD